MSKTRYIRQCYLNPEQDHFVCLINRTTIVIECDRMANLSLSESCVGFIKIVRGVKCNQTQGANDACVQTFIFK